MTDISTMIMFTEAILSLDRVQALVDASRVANPANQEVQLRMDRTQAELDRKRSFIELTIADIASRN